MRNGWCIVVAAMAFGANAAYASSETELENTRRELAASKGRQESISRQNKALEAELVDLQMRLVAAAARVQKGEAELSAAEEKLRVMDAQLAEKKEALEKRKKYLGTLVQASLRLSRTPPEAIVLMPGDSSKTMKAARALKMTSVSIKTQAEALRLQLEELEVLQQKVLVQRDTLRTRQKTFAKEQRALADKVEARRKLQEKLNAEALEEADKLARLARQAQDLEGLVSRLQKPVESSDGEILQVPSSTPQGRRGKIRSFASAKGRIRPPLSGRVIQSFGSENRRNETHRGLTILARPYAQVTAPYDGEVIYAGTFLNYGRMVIIRHSDSFHTLLAGLARLDTGAGEFLLEGEPIGAMGEKESSARLYMELRRKNQPIDPAPWLNN